MKKQMLKSVLSVITIIALILGLFPFTVFANQPNLSLDSSNGRENTVHSPNSTTSSAEVPNPSLSPDPSEPLRSKPEPTPTVSSDTVAVTDGQSASEAVNAPPSTVQPNAQTFQTVPRAVSDFSPHIIPGITPRGTTVNLFDYWSANTPETNDYQKGLYDSNINQNHNLKFCLHDSSNDRLYNNFTGSSNPRRNIVKSKLDPNGYPSLNPDVTDSTESLAYLFDPSINHAGKKSFTNVKKLLQIDENGYYTYNSASNFASFDKTSNSFNLYDQGAVFHNGSTYTQYGQFFPFDTAEEVFEPTLQNKSLVPKKFFPKNAENDPKLNHYFGLTMSTHFIQQNDGYTDKSKTHPVTYEFSGDDDVWVFIDDVLIGDLGGIHSAAKLQINFVTGEVLINDTNKTTLKDQFLKAGVSGNQKFKGNTFINDTYHELKFFYLERGNVDSNMRLKYNLVTIPEGNIIKIDQLGNPIPNVTFKLYQATNSTYALKGNLVCTVTTDENGNAIIKDSKTQRILTLSYLYDRYGDSYILSESNTPPGYRSPGDIKLKIIGKPPNDLIITCLNTYETGVYAMPKARLTAPTAIQYYKEGKVPSGAGSLTSPIETVNLQPGFGTLFAVVMKYEGPVDSNGNATTFNKPSSWVPISGNPDTGWIVAKDNNMQSIIDAAKSYDIPYIFRLESDGSYKTDVTNMPGDILSYYYMLPKEEIGKTRFTVACFYSTSQNPDLISVNNTYPVVLNDGQGNNVFEHVFAADLYITNIANNLILQKTDQNRIPVNGATFTLYKDEGCTQPHSQVTTANLIKDPTTPNGSPITLDGGAYFLKLPVGDYYLKETAAPNGYDLNPTVTKIIVDSSGVYAHAGTETDQVEVLNGPGSIVHSMEHAATSDGIDTTLRNISISLATTDQAPTDKANPKWIWTDHPETKIELVYDNSHSHLDYRPLTEADRRQIVASSGWSTALIKQGNLEYQPRPLVIHQDLGNQNLADLFSQATIVRVADTKLNTFALTKKVTGPYGDLTEAFEFELTIADSTGTPLYGNSTFPYSIYGGHSTPVRNGKLNLQNGKLIDLDTGRNITIKHNQTLQIDQLQEGYQLKAKEIFHTTNQNGYTIHWTMTQKDYQNLPITGKTSETQTERIDTDGNTIIFNNNRSAPAETGFTDDTHPYLPILTIACVLIITLTALVRIRYKRMYRP